MDVKGGNIGSLRVSLRVYLDLIFMSYMRMRHIGAIVKG